MRSHPRYRWFVVGTFFSFMLLHQSDKLLIGSLATPIMETFSINEAQMGAISTGALIVGVFFYPLWGYLYDRFARAKLLALAALIWGSTTWISAIAPTFRTFMLTRATTGIDDSSYSGLYSLVSDYFGPQLRGKVYGLLQISQPLGYMLGMILALTLGDTLGWRSIYYITGSLGVVLALVIFFSIKEAPRGKSEPELAGMDQIGVYRFDWKIFRGLLKKRSLQLIFIQGFFGVFPWNVITYWFFRYLETERNYSDDQIMITMVGAILALSVGYYLGGALGDYAFKRNLSGRLIVGASGTLIGALLLWATMNIPLGNFTLFSVCMVLTSLFMPFASPNIISTVYDISLPEVRSTAMAVESFIEEGGAALAPLLAGLIAVNTSLSTAIQVICITAWLVCVFFFVFAARAVPADIRSLRQQLEERARHEKLLQSGG